MTTILLSTDNSLEVLGLRSLFEKEADLEVIGETTNELPTLKMMIEQHKPDILVLDFNPAQRNGVEFCREICGCSLNMGVILVTPNELDYFVIEAIRVGIKAHLTKASVTSELMRAIRSITSGHRYLSLQLTGIAVDYYINNFLLAPKYSAGILTHREFQVLSLLLQDYDNDEISKQLSMSVRTVECHHYHINRKLGVKNRAQLNEYVLNHGMRQVFEENNSTHAQQRVK